MSYCTDEDLLKYRPNILQLGVTDWEVQREEAFAMINRVIRARWYMTAAVDKGYDPTVTLFNPDLVQEGFLTRLEAFKTLELAYMILMKDSPEADGFERNMETFRDRYNEELELILGTGITYDWSGDEEFSSDEVYVRVPRRLYRA